MESNEIKDTGKLCKTSIVLFAVAAFLLLLQAMFYGMKAVHSSDFHLYMLTLCTIGAIVSTIMLCFKKFGGFCGVLSFTAAYLIIFLFESPLLGSLDVLFDTIGYILPWVCITIGLCIQKDNISTFKNLLIAAKQRNHDIIVNYFMYSIGFMILYFGFLVFFSISPKRGFAPIGDIRLDAPTWLIKWRLSWDGFENDGRNYYTLEKTSMNQAINENNIKAVAVIDRDGLASVLFFVFHANNELYEKIKDDLVNKYGHYYADADVEKQEIIEVWNIKNKKDKVIAQIELHSSRINWGSKPKSLLDCSVIGLQIKVFCTPFIDKRYI